MRIFKQYKMFHKYVYLLRSSSVCVVFMGGCWFCYQLRQISRKLNSLVATNVLDLEHAQAQYIYVDDVHLQDMFPLQNKDLSSKVLEQKLKITDVAITWWKSLDRKLSYRLLHIAQNGCLYDRQKAVRALSTLKYLKDWDYRQIAQMLDARTAVALARQQNVDLRFFLKPLFWHMQYASYDIIENIKQLLIQLDKMCASCHPCLTDFLNKKFHDSPREGFMFDHDLTVFGSSIPSTLIWDEMLLQSCIQAVYHHSSLDEHSKDIVDAGGLKILMEVWKYFEDDPNVSIVLAEILSNISLDSKHLDEIYATGWIGVLAKWAQNNDIRLSAPAARALANLCIDENQNEKYPRRIYLLHPLHESRLALKMDVVFIHGLLGGVFFTWRQRDRDPCATNFFGTYSGNGMESIVNMFGEHPQDFLMDLARDLESREWERLGHDFEVIFNDCPENANSKACGPYTCKGTDICNNQNKRDLKYRSQCWPRDWLAQDVPSLRILGVNYNTNLSLWTPLCPIEGIKSTITERSNELTIKLLMAGIGKRPIIWVCHSMGGLLVKNILIQQWRTNDKSNICQNTRGIVFYSTPHRGSQIAALKQATQMLVWPSVEVVELREGSSQLLQLHNDFLELLKNYSIDIISFSETKSTLVTALKLPFQFVEPISADPGVGEFFEIPQDHLSICKPANRQSFLYQKLLGMIRDHLSFNEKDI